MLATTTVNNKEKVIYTVPSGKTAYVYVDIYLHTTGSLTVKINDLIYFADTPTMKMISIKLIMNSGDTLKVAYTGQANLFVHGTEV